VLPDRRPLPVGRRRGLSNRVLAFETGPHGCRKTKALQGDGQFSGSPRSPARRRAAARDRNQHGVSAEQARESPVCAYLLMDSRRVSGKPDGIDALQSGAQQPRAARRAAMAARRIDVAGTESNSRRRLRVPWLRGRGHYRAPGGQDPKQRSYRFPAWLPSSRPRASAASSRAPAS
jgi:hypothetical protein